MSKNVNFSRISTCKWVKQLGQLKSVHISLICCNFFFRATGNGAKTIQTDKNLDRYIDRLSANSRPIYRTAIFWLSTKCQPTIDRVLTNYWPIHRSSIDQLSVESRRSVGEVLVTEKLYRPRYIWNDYWLCLDQVSTDYGPSLDRLLTAISTECQPTIDCYIDR